MQALLAPLQELAEYGNIREAIRKGLGVTALTGSSKLHFILSSPTFSITPYAPLCPYRIFAIMRLLPFSSSMPI